MAWSGSVAAMLRDRLRKALSRKLTGEAAEFGGSQRRR